jgi:hypothetical protein
LAVGSKRRRAAAIRWRAWPREEAKLGSRARAPPPSPIGNQVSDDRAKPIIDDEATLLENQLDFAAPSPSLSARVGTSQTLGMSDWIAQVTKLRAQRSSLPGQPARWMVNSSVFVVNRCSRILGVCEPLNGGEIDPGGTGPGRLTITGNYTQTATGVLNIDLGGLTAGSQFDQLVVTGSVTFPLISPEPLACPPWP